MKIELSPTNTEELGVPGYVVQHVVTVNHPQDDLTCYDVVSLFRAALIAYGYHPQNIIEAFQDVAEEYGDAPGDDDLEDEGFPPEDSFADDTVGAEETVDG